MIAVRLLCFAFLVSGAAMAARTVKNFLGAAAKATRGYQGPALTLCIGNEAAHFSYRFYRNTNCTISVSIPLSILHPLPTQSPCF